MAMAPDRRAEIEGQLPTLRAEIEKAKEPIVREALEAKLVALEAELAELPESVASESEVETVPIPVVERAKFDLEVQRLRLILSRGEKGPAEAGLKALRGQYGAQGELLEIEGDLATGRKRWKEAEKLYGAAKELLPGNIGVEKKHADAVFFASGMGTLEDQLRASESGTPILEADVVARGGVATLLSFFFPGLGQWVLGQQVKAIAFFGVWLLAIAVILINGRMIPGLLRIIGIGGGGVDPSGLFVFAVIVAALTMLLAVFDCAAIAKRAPKPNTERPKPPVDLPFE